MLNKFKIKNSIKIKNFELKTVIATCFMILLVFWASVTVADAQNKLPAGISVIPSIMYLDLALDPPEYTLTYINNTKSDIKLELSVQDFSELEDDYKINFLETKDAASYKYSLSSWVTLENKNLELTQGEEKSIKVFIDKARITKGGHYASVLARSTQQNVEKQININPVISSLLFVRASTGKEIENGKISTFRPDRNFLNFPENFVLRFENSGNVHVIPYGQIVITDNFGNRVANGILNEKSLDALPESIRKYDIPIIHDSQFMIPGIYTAKIDVHYGNSQKEISRTTIFFSQGSFNFAKIGFVIIIISIIGFIAYKRIRKRKNLQRITKHE